VEFVNPIKLYEYMACGLPVVSTSWQAIREMESPAFLAETEAEFTGAVERALQESSNKSKYIEYARGNNWQARLRQVLELLK
jgi:hypothetical protein